VATQIVDVDYATIKAYPGNYEHFVRAKREERERREAEIAKREAEIADHKAFIERFRAKATKARQAQSKLKAIDRIEIEKLPESSRRYPRFRFDQRRPSGKQVVELEGIRKSYGDNLVLDGIDLTIHRGDRVAIIGPNGIGKSTLLKLMMGEVEPDAGRVEWGYETHPGYVAQDHKTQLGGQAGADRLAIDAWLHNFCPEQGIGFVKGALGAVLFSGDDSKKKLSALSGGEAARLMFARQSIEKPNVLVLDEPTNHLDLEAIEALVEAVKAYDGTLIFVSHDRWFVNELATRIVEISPDGVQDFAGTYDEYLARAGADHLDTQEVLRREREARRLAKGGADGSTPTEAAARATSEGPGSGEEEALDLSRKPLKKGKRKGKAKAKTKDPVTNEGAGQLTQAPDEGDAADVATQAAPRTEQAFVVRKGGASEKASRAGARSGKGRGKDRGKGKRR